jgi:hypothetical protein
MALDEKTEQLMREVFGGQPCSKCSSPASRIVDNLLYCHQHFFSLKRAKPKVYRKPVDAPAPPLPAPPAEVALDDAPRLSA